MLRSSWSSHGGRGEFLATETRRSRGEERRPRATGITKDTKSDTEKVFADVSWWSAAHRELPTPRDLAFQTDKGWAGIHRCLTDGRLAYDNGTDLLRACVLGGEHLYKGDDFVVSLLTPEQVGDVATVLAPIDKASLHTGYKLIDPADYGAPLSDHDFEFLWSCFVGLPEFFKKVASAARG